MLSADSSRAVADLRKLHSCLAAAVEHAEAAFGSFPVPDGRCPTRVELSGLFEETRTIARALAAFLDGLDRYLGNEGADTDSVRLSPEEVRALLAETEPVPKPETVSAGSEFPPAWHPGLPRRVSSIGRLPSFYGYVVSIDNALTKRKLPKSFVWRQAWDLWKTFVYFGGRHAAGGLLARLDQIGKLPGQRKGPRTAAYYPWDRQDIAELHRVADRANFLLTGRDEDIEQAARDDWCKIIDVFLNAEAMLDGVAGMMLATWMDEVPTPDAAVRERLRRLSRLDCLPDSARKKALDLAQ